MTARPLPAGAAPRWGRCSALSLVTSARSARAESCRARSALSRFVSVICGTRMTAATLASSLDSVAKQIDHENDVLVLILTSHGSRGGLVVKAGAAGHMGD